MGSVTESKAHGIGIRLPTGFEYGEVNYGEDGPYHPPASGDPPLGILEKFEGSFAGTGLNTIFRPNNTQTVSTTKQWTKPIVPPPPASPNSATLQLNLTKEELTFTRPLGAVPNRGLNAQEDIMINGVGYFQSVSDVTNTDTGRADGHAINIHAENGFFLNVPATTSNPQLGNTLVRMGSIPHGTTINAQGLAQDPSLPGPQPTKGVPTFGPRSILPFPIGGEPGQIKPQPSQMAIKDDTARLPQDLSLFIKEGTITQEILDNPAKILNDINTQLKILETYTFNLTTEPTTAQPGGGTANIAFLQGENATIGPNANAVKMTATFWIETVSSTITVPVWQPGYTPVMCQPTYDAKPGLSVPPLPVFAVTPSAPVTSPMTFEVQYTQIQYAQIVNLNFNGLTWPHLSLATLVPRDPIHLEVRV